MCRTKQHSCYRKGKNQGGSVTHHGRSELRRSQSAGGVTRESGENARPAFREKRRERDFFSSCVSCSIPSPSCYHALETHLSLMLARYPEQSQFTGTHSGRRTAKIATEPAAALKLPFFDPLAMLKRCCKVGNNGHIKFNRLPSVSSRAQMSPDLRTEFAPAPRINPSMWPQKSTMCTCKAALTRTIRWLTSIRLR